jgi:hypothetical protein
VGLALSFFRRNSASARVRLKHIDLPADDFDLLAAICAVLRRLASVLNGAKPRILPTAL